MRFGRFAEAVGRRYGAFIDAYSIWNEPNHPEFLRPQWTGYRTPTSAALYRQLFQAGERGLAAAGIGSVPVLLGETAPRGTSHVVYPLTFLRRVLCLNGDYERDRSCGRLRADGYAHHPYTTRLGPFFRPPDRRDVTIGSLSRLNRALLRAGRAGAVRRGLPLWLTEFGIQSLPDTQSACRIPGRRSTSRSPSASPDATRAWSACRNTSCATPTPRPVAIPPLTAPRLRDGASDELGEAQAGAARIWPAARRAAWTPAYDAVGIGLRQTNNMAEPAPHPERRRAGEPQRALHSVL